MQKIFLESINGMFSDNAFSANIKEEYEKMSIAGLCDCTESSMRRKIHGDVVDVKG